MKKLVFVAAAFVLTSTAAFAGGHHGSGGNMNVNINSLYSAPNLQQFNYQNQWNRNSGPKYNFNNFGGFGGWGFSGGYGWSGGKG